MYVFFCLVCPVSLLGIPVGYRKAPLNWLYRPFVLISFGALSHKIDNKNVLMFFS